MPESMDQWRLLASRKGQGMQCKCPECRKNETDEEVLRARRNSGQVLMAEYGQDAPPIVHEVLRSSGEPLDSTTRAFFEPRFGHDFSQVRVHNDVRAVKSARAVNALSYTVGKDVVFNEGQYFPNSSEGKRLIAHELTHVIQQSNNAEIAARQSPETPASGNHGAVLEITSQSLDVNQSSELHLQRDGQNSEPADLGGIGTGEVYQQPISSGMQLNCDSPDIRGNGEATSWILTIAAVKEDDPLGIGHAWVKFSDNAGTKYSYGFVPWGDATVYLSADGHVLHPDKLHDPPQKGEQYTEISYALSHENFLRGLIYAQEICKSPPTYNLIANNCSDFAINVARRAGVSPPSASTLGVTSPSQLYDRIVRLRARKGGAAPAPGASVPPPPPPPSPP